MKSQYRVLRRGNGLEVTMNEEGNKMAASESRHHGPAMVTNLSGARNDTPAVLHNASLLLSTMNGFKCVALLLLDEDGHTARVYALNPELNAAGAPIGRNIEFNNSTLALVLQRQTSLHIPRVNDEFDSIPGLIDLARIAPQTSAHIFPMSAAGGRQGLLIFLTDTSIDRAAQDLELMNSVTVLISQLFETTLALEAAESYKQNLARERDRLKLILEINNYTITHLDMSALFRAASKSIHAYFDNAFTGFWLFAERSSRLELLTLDFPRGLGFRENTTTTTLKPGHIADMRARVATIFGADQFNQFPDAIAKTFHENLICTLACVPLVGTNGPLGLISLGSREDDAFDQEDLDLISQVANQISLALDNALAYRRVTFSCERLEEERQYLESELKSQYNFEDIIGNSAAIKNVLEHVAIVAPTDSTVLLIGESGTGKELVARAIHNLSLRRDRTFVRLNCAAVPSGLLESELFGHEKGAFTGALAQRRGRVELAHEGSLFLDEIGDIGLDLQPKLLRVLQEREFERLGSNHTIKVDTRLIAATHRDLPGMVRKGEFREDLFYRLNVFPIHIPPLRDRNEDIPLLVHYFVTSISRKMRKSIRIVPTKVMEAIKSFSWPGNVRELQNFIERSVILSKDETLAAPISELEVAVVPEHRSANTLHGMEREMILNVLRAADGKVSGFGGAAERLGLKRTTLQRKMERLGILKSDYA